MIEYPNIPLPQQTLGGMSRIPVARTEGKNGLPYQEGRFPVILRQYNVTWMLNDEQFQIFEEWFSETLAGGILVFAFPEPVDGVVTDVPYRFIGGVYTSSLTTDNLHSVSGQIERMLYGEATANRTPTVPQWARVGVDPITSRVLDETFRNSLLSFRATAGNTVQLSIQPPINPDYYVYFGLDYQGAGDVLVTSHLMVTPPTPPVPSFPAELPQVNVGFGDRGERQVHRLDMDGGNVRQWLAHNTTRKVYAAKWWLTLEELGIFQEFFFYTLAGGSTPFTIVLPVEGRFVPAVARFVQGEYTERYLPSGLYEVSAEIGRIVDQTVTPPDWHPYGLYYSPRVNVTANRKIYATDAGKFFVVNPAEGQTISLHASTNQIEFGVLNIGLGNVLITRNPFIVDLGLLGDTAGSPLEKPVFTLRAVQVDLALSGDVGYSAYGMPSFTLVEVVKDVGTLSSDTGQSNLAIPTFEILEVQVDIGSLGDSGSSPFLKPVFTIDIP